MVNDVEEFIRKASFPIEATIYLDENYALNPLDEKTYDIFLYPSGIKQMRGTIHGKTSEEVIFTTEDGLDGVIDFLYIEDIVEVK